MEIHKRIFVEDTFAVISNGEETFMGTEFRSSVTGLRFLTNGRADNGPKTNVP